MSRSTPTLSTHGDGAADTDDTVERALAGFLDAFMRLDRDQVRGVTG